MSFDKNENFENDNKILVFEKVFLKTNANIQNEFTLKVFTNGIIVNGSDLIKFAHYLKTNKVSIKKDDTNSHEVIYLVHLNVDLCTSEDIYKICTWMNMKSFISEKTATETILKYFEYRNRRKKVDPLSQIMKDYNGLEIAVKNIMDKMILIFYKFLNPQSYKKGIMHVDPNEVIKELYENTINSEEMQKSYADTIFNTYVNLPELEIVTEILPESIRNFYETGKEHFKRMLMLTALKSLEKEVKKIPSGKRNDDVKFEKLFFAGNEYFYRHKGRESCVLELKELVNEIDTTADEKNNNSIAHKIKRKVETMIQELYKR